MEEESEQLAACNHGVKEIRAYNSCKEFKGNFGKSMKERREKCLEDQKNRQNQNIDHRRQQFHLFVKTADDDGIEELETAYSIERLFKFRLMKTDWFTEIPDDLEENWLIKCAPEGIRVMLVSRGGLTICYNRVRQSILEFESNLPGGGEMVTPDNLSVLDCIYNENTKTFFLFDCLCWNKLCMIDADANFRFCWLKSQFKDYPQLSRFGEFKFVPVDYMPAQRPLIQDAMFEKFTVNCKQYYYDGIAFYHKDSHYYFDNTPLVGWLASYMLTELLHIDVSQEHLVKKPLDYVCAKDHIRKLQKRLREYFKRNKKFKKECLELYNARHLDT